MIPQFCEQISVCKDKESLRSQVRLFIIELEKLVKPDTTHVEEG